MSMWLSRSAYYLALGVLAAGALCSPVLAQCQVAKLTADDGAAGDRFGHSVSISANVVVTGAPRNDEGGYNAGAVYVFERDGGAWSLVVKLIPDSGAGLGRTASVDGNFLVVGSSSTPTCVFERCGDTWCEVAELIRDDYEPGEQIYFGRTGALSGSVAVIGAPNDDDNGYLSGSAYVFERAVDGSWSQAAKLLADDGEPYEHFGTRVAVDGNLAVVSAPQDYGWQSGAAYVFERDQAGAWRQVAKLVPDDGHWSHGFGYGLAVSGDVVLGGAADAPGNEAHCGAAYVFEPDADGGWAQTAKLTADDGVIGDAFGVSIALDGSVALIGAPGVSGQAEDAGAAYVFLRREVGNWIQVAKLFAEDGARDDNFGARVALTTSVGVVAAPGDDDQGEDSGSAYVFAVGPDEDGDGIMDACECPGDLNHDWIVDYYDLAVLLADWGCTAGDCPGDCDRDGDTDHADLGLLLANWGNVCP